MAQSYEIRGAFNKVQILNRFGLGTNWGPTWDASKTESKFAPYWRPHKSHKFELQKWITHKCDPLLRLNLMRIRCGFWIFLVLGQTEGPLEMPAKQNQNPHLTKGPTNLIGRTLLRVKSTLSFNMFKFSNANSSGLCFHLLMLNLKVYLKCLPILAVLQALLFIGKVSMYLCSSL